MNGFVLSSGAFVTALTDLAVKTGEKMGKISVDMGGTACQVPYIPDYLKKMETAGRIGKKRKGASC
jgi:hypothetical protein